jgi:hypothetical protein
MYVAVVDTYGKVIPPKDINPRLVTNSLLAIYYFSFFTLQKKSHDVLHHLLYINFINSYINKW